MLLALLALALIAAGARHSADRPRGGAAARARPRGRPRRRARSDRPAALRPRPRAPRRAARPRAAALLRQRRGVGDVPRPRLHPGLRQALAARGRSLRRGGPAYAYLVYPHKPIVAYVPASGQLLSEYCVEFPDLTGSGGAPPPARLRRRARQVDGAHLRRGPRDPARQHAPGRPPARPGPRAPRPLAARRVGAPPPAPAAKSSRAAAARSKATATSAARSRVILDGPDRAQARALPEGHRLRRRRAPRPIVGIANTWTETMPCNFHLRRLAERVKDGVRAAGGTPMEFNTVAVSDGITMGTRGHADLAGQPRGDRRLDRAGRPRPHVRRDRRPVAAATRRSPAA